MKPILLAALALLAFPTPGTAEPNCGLYQYKAKIIRVVDGDTVVADIDLGFNTWRRDEYLRLDGVDTPERKKATMEGWRRAKDALAKRIEGKELMICTVRRKTSDAETIGKYGRYLVQIWDGGTYINDWLIAEGYGVPYDGD